MQWLSHAAKKIQSDDAKLICVVKYVCVEAITGKRRVIAHASITHRLIKLLRKGVLQVMMEALR